MGCRVAEEVDEVGGSLEGVGERQRVISRPMDLDERGRRIRDGVRTQEKYAVAKENIGLAWVMY